MQESEWKRFRELHVVWLNRFCEKVLREISQIAGDTEITPHERYRQIYKIIEQQDRSIAYAINDLRRSTALMQLVAIHSRGLVTDEELSGFTQKTRDIVLSYPARRD